MHNFPNITPAEVAVVCTAALLLCIVPNLMVWSDARRQRRRRRAELAQATMPRSASEESTSVSPATMDAPASSEPEATQGEALQAPPVSSAPTLESAAAVVAAPAMAPGIELGAGNPEPMAASTPAAVTPPEPGEEEAIHDFRLDELRRVKLPNWPPQEVRDNPERKRVWDEAVRVAEQPLITSMRLRSPRLAESACLCAADSEGSVLRLRFLLFPELWPVAAEQATAAVVFEIDSGSGDVRSSVRSL